MQTVYRLRSMYFDSILWSISICLSFSAICLSFSPSCSLRVSRRVVTLVFPSEKDPQLSRQE